MVFAPNVEISPITLSRTEFPSATTTTTAATPIKIPRTVNEERTFERAIARNESRIAARIDLTRRASHGAPLRRRSRRLPREPRGKSGGERFRLASRASQERLIRDRQRRERRGCVVRRLVHRVG